MKHKEGWGAIIFSKLKELSNCNELKYTYTPPLSWFTVIAGTVLNDCHWIRNRHINVIRTMQWLYTYAVFIFTLQLQCNTFLCIAVCCGNVWKMCMYCNTLKWRVPKCHFVTPAKQHRRTSFLPITSHWKAIPPIKVLRDNISPDLMSMMSTMAGVCTHYYCGFMASPWGLQCL